MLCLMLVLGMTGCNRNEVVIDKDVGITTFEAQEPATEETTSETKEADTQDAEASTPEPEEMQGTFTKQLQFTDKAGKTVDTLPYWLYTPANAEEGMPLIVVLHSALVKAKNDLGSEANLDNMVKDADDLPKFIYNGELGDIPAYIVMPQTDGASRGWAKRASELAELVGYCEREYGIDKENVSIAGYSLGGTGAIEVAAVYPEVFSRVLSVAGGLDGVSNNTRPYVQGVGRFKLDDSDYSALRVLKSGSSTEYEKEKMKYLYAASGDICLALSTDEKAAARTFENERINTVADVLKDNEISLWTIVGSKDVEVEPSVSERLCDAVGETAKNDNVEDYSHAMIIDHCRDIRDEITDYLLNG